MAAPASAAGPTRIVLVEDHMLMGNALAAMFQESDDFDLVGRAASAADMLAGWERWDPDLALVDVELPDRSGIDASKELLARRPDAGVVFYSGTKDDRIVGEAALLGARGFLSKEVDPTELLPNLRRALTNPPAFDQVTSSLAVRGMASAREAGKAGVTERERQIVELVAQGRTNEAIAGKLGVSAATVKTLLGRARMKLDAADRASVVNNAIKSGIISTQ